MCVHNTHTVQQNLVCAQYSVNTETLENKREPSYIVGGNAATMENSMAVVQKMKKRTTIWSTNPTPEETIIQNNTGTSAFLAALFAISKTWKQPGCPSTDEWMKQMRYKYAMECYSVIENEILPIWTIWLQVEMIILSAVSQILNMYSDAAI